MSTGTAQDIINQLDAKIREARGTIKDLNRIKKEMKKIVNQDIHTQIKDKLNKELNELERATRDAVDDAVDRVGKTFSNLEDIYMGREKRDTEDLEEMTIRYMIREEVERYIEQNMTFKEPTTIHNKHVAIPKLKKKQ